jgi:hypothetical protein
LEVVIWNLDVYSCWTLTWHVSPKLKERILGLWFGVENICKKFVLEYYIKVSGLVYFQLTLRLPAALPILGIIDR